MSCFIPGTRGFIPGTRGFIPGTRSFIPGTRGFISGMGELHTRNYRLHTRGIPECIPLVRVPHNIFTYPMAPEGTDLRTGKKLDFEVLLVRAT